MVTAAVFALAALLAQDYPAAGGTGPPALPSVAVSEALRLQVMLDREGFSPGVIDGVMGANTRRAFAVYQQHRRDAEPVSAPPLTTYTVTDVDVAGPFVPAIPADLVDQARLGELAYTSALEMLAERFHTTPALLQRLNPSARFGAGEQILVPNVEPLIAPVQRPQMSTEARAAERAQKVKTNGPGDTAGRGGGAGAQPNTILQRPDVLVTVSQTNSALTVTDTSGAVIFHAPVTTGSQHDPLPIGEWTVRGIQFNPPFHYNPDLFWDADPSHAKAKIPPGPNNPVGLVWIDLSKEHYGIHGTPEPAAVGRAQSHGCVRLTNWDALKLAGMVKPGTKVRFTE